MNGIRKLAFHAARYNRQKYLDSDVRSRPLQSVRRTFFILSRPEKGLQKRVNLMQQKRIQTCHVIIYRVSCVIWFYRSIWAESRRLANSPKNMVFPCLRFIRWVSGGKRKIVVALWVPLILIRSCPALRVKKPVNYYPRTKPFGGAWKRLYYVWKAMRSWEISSKKNTVSTC